MKREAKKRAPRRAASRSTELNLATMQALRMAGEKRRDEQSTLHHEQLRVRLDGMLKIMSTALTMLETHQRRLVRVVVGDRLMDIAASGDITASHAVNATDAAPGLDVNATYRLWDGTEVTERTQVTTRVVVVVAAGKLWIATPELVRRLRDALIGVA